MTSDYLSNKIYDTLDAEKRIFLAAEYLKENGNPEFAEALNKIINIRYSGNIIKGEKEYIDNFMKIWVDIAYYAKDSLSDRRSCKLREKFLKQYAGSDIVKLHNSGVIYQDLLYCEFRHLCRVYIYSCTESKSYSRYFDLVPIKQSKLYNMIQYDLQRIGITYAGKFGFDELLPEFIEAVQDELDDFQIMAERKSNCSSFN